MPKGKLNDVVVMMQAIHSREDREESLKKAQFMIKKLQGMKLKKAAKVTEDGVEKTLTYTYFPRKHWLMIRTNNPLERILREVRRRTRVVGALADGNSALMLVIAHLRHAAGAKWGSIRYLKMDRLKDLSLEEAMVG